MATPSLSEERVEVCGQGHIRPRDDYGHPTTMPIRFWLKQAMATTFVAASIDMIAINKGTSMVVTHTHTHTLSRYGWCHPNRFLREGGGMWTWPPDTPEMSMAIPPPCLNMLWSRGGNGHHTPHR